MIRPMPRREPDRSRWHLRRQWRPRFVLLRIVHLDDVGRSLVVARWLETRWSDTQRRRRWRLPQ